MTAITRGRCVSLGALLAAVSAAPSAHGEGWFVGLGDLPGTSIPFFPSSLSSNGRVAAGAGLGVANQSEAAYWTSGGGVVRLGDIGGASPPRSYALAVSGDGGRFVGYGSTPWGGAQAAAAAPGGTLQTLYGPPAVNFDARARAVSYDGSVVVGLEESPSGRFAFRWTQAGGRQTLGAPSGPGSFSEANGVSADGSVVVGRRDGVGFRWTAAGGWATLPDLPGGPTEAEALGVSGDGATAVGAGFGANGHQVAVRWDAAGNVFALGPLSALESRSAAFSCSFNGSVIGGQSVGNSQPSVIATVWDPAHGTRPALAYLADFGVTAPGWQLTSVSAVSADGTTLAGLGTDPLGVTRGWVAVVPAPASAVLLAIAAASVGRRRRIGRVP